MAPRNYNALGLTFVLITACLQGCTANLYVTRIDPTSGIASVIRQHNTPLHGKVDYYLPRGVITLNGTAELESCSDSKLGATISVKATVTPAVTTEPDPAFHYEIDLRKSRSWRKAVNISVSTQSGFLQNFNGSISDQIGPDVTAALGTLVQVGGAVAVGIAGQPELIPLTTAPLGACLSGTTCTKQQPRFNSQICRTSALTALIKIKKLKIQLDAERTIIPKDETALTEKTQKLQFIQTKIANLRKQLTRSFSFRWAPHASDLTHATQDGKYYLLYKKVSLKPLLPAWVKRGQTIISYNESLKVHHHPPPILLTLLIDSRTVGSAILNDKQDLFKGHQETVDDPQGLLLREPARAVLRICRETNSGYSTCNQQVNVTPTDGTIVDTTEDIGNRLSLQLPQFGTLLLLPERNGLFESDTLSVSINSDGTIESISDNSSSAASTGLTALGSAASSAQSALAARATAISNLNTANQAVVTAKTTQMEAPDTYNKTLADCLSQATAVTAAGGTPVPCK